jgi:hypothetical protein
MYTSLKYDVFCIIDAMLPRFQVTYVEGSKPSFKDRSTASYLNEVNNEYATP